MVAAGNLLVLREPRELRNLPRLPTKIKYRLVFKMVTLRENIDSSIFVMFQDQRDSTPQKFENGSFTLKLHQLFSVHTTPELGFEFDKHSEKEIKC